MNKNANSIKTEFDHQADQLIDSLFGLSPDSSDSKQSLYQQASNHFITRLIFRALQWANGSQSKAARKLGITRATFRRRMRECGISKETFKANKQPIKPTNEDGEQTFLASINTTTSARENGSQVDNGFFNV